MNIIDKIKEKYTPVIPFKELPYCIYKNTILTLFLCGIAFIFLLFTFLLTFEMIYIFAGIPIIFTLLIIFWLWLSDYLYNRIIFLEGTVKEFSNTEKSTQNVIRRKFLNRIVRTTYTLQLENGMELKVVCSDSRKLKVGKKLRIYFTSAHLIVLDDGSYFLNQASFTEFI